jgi:C-terminus of AA_permease
VTSAYIVHFQVYGETPGFSCPGVPFVPIMSIFFNIFLFAQVFALNPFSTNFIFHRNLLIDGVQTLCPIKFT